MGRFVASIECQPHPSAFWFALRGNDLLVDDAGRVPRRNVSAGAVILGLLDDVPCFATSFDAEQEAPSGFSFRSLRSLYGTLDEDSFSLAGRAMQLLEWDRNHRFCGKCGKPTAALSHERNRKCAACETSHYPRVSPAVIGVVEKDGKILLARNALASRPFYSCVAGFVDTGESLEEAFAREVKEEVGLGIRDVRYFGSQSWPFTSSLMVGFTAVHAEGDIQVDGKEIADAHWFSPDALPEIPPRLSIARALIDDFLSRHASK